MLKPKLHLMDSVITKTRTMLLIKGLIMVLLSALIFLNPAEAILSYAVYIGMGAVLAGVLILFKSISVRSEVKGWGWGALEGLLDLFIGYVLLSKPGLTADVLPLVIGFWGAFYGIMLIIDAFSGNGSLMLKLLAGILILIVSNVMIVNPMAAGMSLAVWVSVILLISGIYNIVIYFSTKNL